MRAFDDIDFLAGACDRRCRGRLQQASFPHHALQLILATPSHGIHFRRGREAAREIVDAQLCWHRPDTVYSYGALSGWWHHCWVAMRGERARRLIEDGFDLAHPAGLAPVADPALARSRFERLVALIGSGPAATRGEATVLVEQLLLQSLPLRSASPLQRLVERIDAAPATGWDWHACAAACGWSDYHFRRRFRHYTGRSPQDYLLARRLQRAAADLCGGNAPVAVIAQRNGFGHAGHFARLFRRRFGCSPSAFRQGYR
ncbi:MAG: AraC family transcriptional regulator [Planctomycetota bacterium]